MEKSTFENPNVHEEEVIQMIECPKSEVQKRIVNKTMVFLLCYSPFFKSTGLYLHAIRLRHQSIIINILPILCL